jgi:hypothetical protein
MDKVSTAQEAARRLEAHVAAHGCCGSCDLCSDLDTCLAPVTAPRTRPVLLPSFRVLPRPDGARERREALARAWEERFQVGADF